LRERLLLRDRQAHFSCCLRTRRRVRRY